MRPEVVRAALHATGLKPNTSRLLAHMADVCDDRGLFYERRTVTARLLGVHADTIKLALAELIGLGYVSNVLDARAGRHPRHVQLHPERWEQPEDPRRLADSKNAGSNLETFNEASGSDPTEIGANLVRAQLRAVPTQGPIPW